MPVRLHHIVIDAHDLPTLARFWSAALGWKILSEREREIVIGADDNAPVGICFMPVTDTTTSGFPYPPWGQASRTWWVGRREHGSHGGRRVYDFDALTLHRVIYLRSDR
jgi:catechol 2,3-dioxygenase-like lactoylglutathione lyase family enzyme